ncbi:MAG: ATP-binding protein [Thermoleophilia bacterium]|nr:ATP-binding protein [Thermoleophilia bacterium]
MESAFPPSQAIEASGKFYLGRTYDLRNKTLGDAVFYDSTHLLTHAVCVGMTGSGKTGLCIALLEEAALEGIPAIVIDPKGDLTNLLLVFPELRAEDLLPWLDPEEAVRNGLSLEEFAQKQADLWRQGLAEWGQDPSRLARLRESADFALYTPGSTAGLPVSVLSSFAAPPPAVRDDPESLADRVNTTVGSLLGLIGVPADPVKSKEHVLLSALFHSAWTAGEDLDLGKVIRQVQEPPFSQLGVLPLESFFPAKERAELAMTLNSLLAAPSFQTWLEGESIDVARMLRTSEGRPRVCVFTLSHLSDSERMFFVSLLLNEVVGWMRSQAGTGSLRALLYMDEIFGFFPPIAEPPAKRPLLTLLKQARAFGVGVVLATQNPVDLDYKGLANTGTWFIGRLQTDRDKARVIEALEGISGGAEGRFSSQEMSEILAGLEKRVFLLYNVRSREPVTFHTRWTMSYLAGPLTRAQIKILAERGLAGAPSTARTGTTVVSSISTTASLPPTLPPDIPQYFLPPALVGRDDSLAATSALPSQTVYRPAILASAIVNFVSPQTGKAYAVRVTRAATLAEPTNAPDWDQAQLVETGLDGLERESRPNAAFLPLPAAMTKPASYRAWKDAYEDWLFRTQSLELLRSPSLKTASEPGETPEEFRARLERLAEERLTRETEKVQAQFAAKRRTLESKIMRAEQARAREAEQARDRKFQTAVSLGATIMSAFLGKKVLKTGTLGRAATTMRDVSRTVDQTADVKRAEEVLNTLKQELAQLAEQEQKELDELKQQIELELTSLESLHLRPRKSGIVVDTVGLVWMPVEVAKSA